MKHWKSMTAGSGTGRCYKTDADFAEAWGPLALPALEVSETWYGLVKQFRTLATRHGKPDPRYY